MSAERHLDTAARALNALLATDAGAFDAHLDGCDACAEEFTGFLETVAQLGAAAAEDPPERLHDRVMRAISVTPQLPPLEPTSLAVRSGPESDGDTEAASTGGSVTPIRRWYRRPSAMLAAAAAVILIVGGVILGTRGATPNPTAALTQCVQSAPDARVARPSVGGGGQVTFAASCNAAVVDVGALPALPADKGYQLWVMAGTVARSVGMVQEGMDRLGSVFVASLRPGDTDIGISLEPAGGSKSPTTTPLWVVPLST